MVFANFSKEGQAQSGFLQQAVLQLRFGRLVFFMYSSECICFVVCFGQILGLRILECLFFFFSLEQVSIPETVLMYLGYYSKNAVRLSGNVKVEARSGC